LALRVNPFTATFSFLFWSMLKHLVNGSCFI
jgi:hypothetical protein